MNTWQKDQAVLGAMYPLEQAGWVMRIDDGTKEHQHVAQWAINPEIKTIFKAHREKVIKAKQALMDEVRAATRAGSPKVKYYDQLQESMGSAANAEIEDSNES
jgi:adenine-specific DNA methylase